MVVHGLRGRELNDGLMRRWSAALVRTGTAADCVCAGVDRRNRRHSEFLRQTALH